MTTAQPWTERLEAMLPELLELRRHLHAHPELSGEEHHTAALLAGALREAGWRLLSLCNWYLTPQSSVIESVIRICILGMKACAFRKGSSNIGVAPIKFILLIFSHIFIIFFLCVTTCGI